MFFSSHAERNDSVIARLASFENGSKNGAQTASTMMVGSTFWLGRQPCSTSSGPMRGSVDCIALINATTSRAGSGVRVSAARS